MTIKNSFTLILLLFLASCGGSLTGNDEGVVANPDVGTNMGNPKTRPTSLVSLTFKAQAPEIASDTTLSCSPLKGVNDTQRCYMSSPKMTLGVLAVYYVDCLDSAGESVGCLSPDVVSVGERFLAYDSVTSLGADQDFDLDLSATEAAFSQPLNPLEKEMNVGGIQLVTSYLKYQVPENKAVMESLRSLPLLHCTSPDTLSETQKAAFCANPTSLRGDITFDADGDGSTEYLNYPAADLEFLEDRPADYASYTGANPIAHGSLHYLAVEGFEFTDGVDYAVPGHFAPVLGFEKFQTWMPDTEEVVEISFDLKDTLAFVDGGRFGIKDGEKRAICVGESCAYNADPLTAGKYDYHFDGALHTILPKVSASID